MSACCRHVLGLLLSIIGFLGTILICVLPLWKISLFKDSSITTSQIHYVGLWVTCAGEMPCKSYNSIQDLPKDLQGARVLIVFAIIIEFCGILLSVVGSKCINFVPNKWQKTKVVIASGVLFFIAGILVALPVSSCWINSVNFNSLFLDDIHTVFPGPMLYIGCLTAGLLCLGGGLLCCSFSSRNETEYEVGYSRAESVEAR
ncbi:claudin-4-like [Simochromis diagramma]|uniref:claudin-4-like n=1 Tax=Simochromis diagramma TaxID=43689 RepID=UPI001A7E9137|nr:claudin-4-like [Simochromis diagramma]